MSPVGDAARLSAEDDRVYRRQGRGGAGMIKHGAKMIQAVSNATVPRITILAGTSFGAGNYGMYGRGFRPRFCFSWPNAGTAVMGAEQVAMTMAIVTQASQRCKGKEVSQAALAALKTDH